VARIAWVVAVALGCGDNVHVAADAAPDGIPDLAIAGDRMNGTTITTQTFAATDCEVVEGCAVVGARRLLRFDTVTENVGTADLVLGQVPPPGVSSGLFVWSPCHMHHHVAGYADFALLDAGGTVATGRKQGFCLEDDIQVSPVGPSHGYTCNFQGVSVDWADVYDRSLPCQWIDITGVAPGTYTLQITVDPSHIFPDADRSNNRFVTSVVL
jgi:hypothetical protein